MICKERQAFPDRLPLSQRKMAIPYETHTKLIGIDD